jgi:fructan beta-fructosidase
MKRVFFAIIALFLMNQGSLAQQKTIYRPTYHYTPPKNWVNDPNGLVYLDGEYHLFTQYNPYGATWGHMSWGHAVSKDLQNWQTLPIAMEEYSNQDSTKTMLFSGCAVVDSLNTSGLFRKGFKKGLVAIFTSHVHSMGKEKVQHQSLMYSADKGRTWKLYNQNPILDLQMTNFRDPNVIWLPERQVWIMTVVKPLLYTVQFYESKNLINWTLLSEFENQGDVSKIWECPSLSKVPIENSKDSKWMLTISSGHKQAGYVGMQYFIGDFDGYKFTSQNQDSVFQMDYGKDYYAAIPYFNLPKKHSKPIMLGWINNWAYANAIPTGKYRGGYSIPRELSIFKENETCKLKQTPIKLKGIEEKNISVKSNQKAASIFFKSDAYILNLKIETSINKGFDLEILKSESESTKISYDPNTEILSFDRTKSGKVAFHSAFASIEKMPLKAENGFINLKIIVDKSIVEIFANGGKAVLTDLVFPTKTKNQVKFTWNK